MAEPFIPTEAELLTLWQALGCAVSESWGTDTERYAQLRDKIEPLVFPDTSGHSAGFV